MPRHIRLIKTTFIKDAREHFLKNIFQIADFSQNKCISMQEIHYLKKGFFIC